LGIEVGPSARDSHQACSDFIEQHQDAFYRMGSSPETGAWMHPSVQGYGPYTEQQMPTWTPTDKQLAFADTIARSLGIEVGPSARHSRQACSDFIEQHQGAFYRMDSSPETGAWMPMSARPSAWSSGQTTERTPTPNQIDFAENLAASMGVALPLGARVSADMCSTFISDLKAAQDLLKKWKREQRLTPEVGAQAPTYARPSMGGHDQLADNPPTQKQLALAETLASQAYTEVPQNVRRSFRQCSMFIDDIKAAAKAQARPVQAWNVGGRL